MVAKGRGDISVTAETYDRLIALVRRPGKRTPRGAMDALIRGWLDDAKHKEIR